MRQDWVARYEGPVADTPLGLALDGAGDVFVTGQSTSAAGQQSFRTVKYDRASGAELWNSAYWLGAGVHIAWAVAVDRQGNVIVSGRSEGRGSGSDWATVKYDGASGRLLWVARYDHAGGQDSARDLALDLRGDVYVTGSSDGGASGLDCVTIKYDGASGRQLWLARYDGPAGGNDVGLAVACGPVVEGPAAVRACVCVAASSAGVGTGQDWVTLRYDPRSGAVLWAARFDGGDGLRDVPEDLALDEAGNAYVTGWSVSSASGADYATVRYDADGTLSWASFYDGTAGASDFAQALALGPAVGGQAALYVTGGSSGSGSSYDCVTIKYDRVCGAELWVRRLDSAVHGDDRGADVAVDGRGDCYVTGRYRNNRSFTDWDYLTVKYAAGGGERWRVLYNGPGAGKDLPTGIALDRASPAHVFVTGWSVGSATAQDYATVRYSQRPGAAAERLAGAPDPG